MTATRNGFLNFVPQVHNTTQRTASENFYGSSTTLGKSDIGIYSSNFVNSNAITRVTQREIANRFYSDRDDIVTTTVNPNRDNADYNPDFPKGTVQFNYSETESNLRNISRQGNIEASASAIIKSIPEIDPDKNVTPDKNILPTDDLSGRYTPNLDVVGLDFNGNVSNPQRVVNGASGGGYGSDREIPQDSAFTFFNEDIHKNTIARNNSTIERGVLQLVKDQSGASERGVLGSFKSKDFTYDGSRTLQ
jgi:hypothetical protein